MGKMLFLFDFEFVPYQNPPDTMDRFTADLKAFFIARGVDYGISGLGGMKHCRGQVGSDGRPIIEDDRQALARWAMDQRVQCTARLGALERYHEDIQFFREVTEWVFGIDNLTSEDRVIATEWRERIKRRVQQLHAEYLKNARDTE